MDGTEIRKVFLRFFEERGHRVVPSASLIPNDPTLLLTGAGMNQFKPYLLGLEEPPYPRAASVQKVFRASDLENVGHTDRHLTFFEMMGNFSFGDYFKEKAIPWGFELVTEGFGIAHERLWVTVYEEDEEARRIWTEVGMPPERIVRRGRFDEQGEPANFWWMHVAGPCGPCSEIFVDRGPKYGPEGGPDVDEERFVEIWNIVFMQDECDGEANVIRPLPKQNIDTGSSLERVALVLQDGDTVFDTDLLRPLLDASEKLTGLRYGEDERTDVGLRIMAEHGRATTFLMADGVLPSNEGRGYVLRRMLRRLVTYARRLGMDRPVMEDLVETTVGVMGAAYPELVQNKAFVLQVAASEEERFAATLRQGLQLLETSFRGKAGTPSVDEAEPPPGTLPGDVAFRLHDTYGFPLELTIELAREQGLAVDADAFARLMDEQRRRGREAAKRGDVAEGALGDIAAASGSTEFLGYELLEAEGTLVGMVVDDLLTERAEEGQQVRFVLNRTPFYAEGGGQVGDAGTVRTDTALMQVTDTRPGPGGTIVHEGIVREGQLSVGQTVEAAVDAERREATARSHTATHVLHHTLRRVLGEHARQAGSLVAPGRLRFDFTHFESVPHHVLEEIEYLANRRLADDQPVRAYETTLEFARNEGAIALFGEKYGEIVRVVEIGDYSIELCGGTHVPHTGKVAMVRVIGEASIGSGFRRVEALTGPDALRQVNVERRLLEEVMEAIGAGDLAQTPERVRHAVARIKQLESELGSIRRAERAREVERLASQARDVRGVALVTATLDGVEADELRETAVALRGRLAAKGAGAVVLATAGDGKALMVAACTKDAIARGVTAPALLEPAARAIGGGGGGRKPDVAFAGGSRPGGLAEALAGVPGRLVELLTP